MYSIFSGILVFCCLKSGIKPKTETGFLPTFKNNCLYNFSSLVHSIYLQVIRNQMPTPIPTDRKLHAKQPPKNPNLAKVPSTHSFHSANLNPQVNFHLKIFCNHTMTFLDLRVWLACNLTCYKILCFSSV